MNRGIENLCGSDSKDAFKLWHKQKLSSTQYASDGDLFLIDFRSRRPIALLDHKRADSKLTEAERILYDFQISHGVPVFIVVCDTYVESDENDRPRAKIRGEVIVQEYPSLKLVARGGESDYAKWEGLLRRNQSKFVQGGA